MTTIYIVRHAQSRPSEGVAHDQWPLSDKGQKQAQLLVPVLSKLDIEFVYTSPFRRCVETIAPFVESSGLLQTIDKRLRERALAPRLIPNFKKEWIRSWEDFDYCLPGGESNRDGQKRMVSAMHEIAQAHLGKTILVSSHGNAIGLFINALYSDKGRSVTEKFRNPELLRFSYTERRFDWDQAFDPPAPFHELASHVNETPIEASWGKTFFDND